MQQIEIEMESMQTKHQTRLQALEQEWQQSLDRARRTHQTETDRLVEQHQDEVQRLQARLQADNDDSLHASTELVQRQRKSISEMLAKWEQSAHRIELLQKSVITRQEELAHVKSDDTLLASGKLADIEQAWRTFLEEMHSQRAHLEQVVLKEKDKSIEEQCRANDAERARIDDEKGELKKLRAQFDREVSEWREQQTVQAERFQQEKDKHREEVQSFDMQRTLLETLYQERNKSLDQDQARLKGLNEELMQKRQDLDQEQAEIRKTLFRLQSEMQQYSLSKVQFDTEKEQLQQLGQSLEKRAEELEKLSQVALKEKLDGMQAMEEIDSFRNEINAKMMEIEQATIRLQQDDHRLQMEKFQLEQQWKAYRQLKESVVCNLCGTALATSKSKDFGK